MIITCEKCGARYLLTLLLLGGKGRSVRCGVCGHSWFQEPEQIEDLQDEDEGDSEGGATEGPSNFQEILEQESIEPIPEGVRPIPESSSVPAMPSPPAARVGPGRDIINGFLAAAAIFIIVSCTLIAARDLVVRMWQPSAFLFERAGFAVPVAGEGLVFDKVTAVVEEDGKTLIVKGNIINLRDRESPLPPVQATLQKSGETLMVKLDKKVIGPEETHPFTAKFDRVSEDIADVNVRFVAR